MKRLLGVVLSFALLGGTAMAAPFTPAEMIQAAEAALTNFTEEFGSEVAAEIYGIQTTKTSGGGKVKIYYKNDAGENQSQEYFCHYHGPEGIDCH